MTYVADYIKAKILVNRLEREVIRQTSRAMRMYIKKHHIVNLIILSLPKFGT